MNKIKKLIDHSQQEVHRLNEEYEQLAIKNEKRSSLIKSSMSSKSKDISKRKEKRSKHFDSIRSK